MCGIAGLLDLSGAPLRDPGIAIRMASFLVHRGPDDAGSLADGPMGFGVRRLSIIDLEKGHQPISNQDETVWVILNGEVYNYLELRSELSARGYRFRTRTDTEVIVHAYDAYGLKFVEQLRGMFAIALWDRSNQRLILARDRVGKKPLFYGIRGDQLAFASEIKSFLGWPLFERTISSKALHDYLTFLYVPGPDSIFEEIRKLPPAPSGREGGPPGSSSPSTRMIGYPKTRRRRWRTAALKGDADGWPSPASDLRIVS